MTARILVAVPSLAVLLAAGAAALVFTSEHEPSPWPTAALSTATGLAFVGAGSIAAARRPQNRTGLLMVLVGLTWFVGALGESNHALPYSLGIAFDSLPFVPFAWLVLAYPSGRLQTPVDRALVGLTAVLALLAQPSYYLFADQRELCPACPENVLMVSRQEALAAGIEVVFRGIAVAVLVAGVAVLARRWRRATPALRRALTPVLSTATLAVAVLAVRLVAELFVDRLDAAFDWLLVASLLAVPLAFVSGLLRTRLARAEIGRLLLEVRDASEPDGVQEALRRALRDPTLRLALWVDHARRYVTSPARTSSSRRIARPA